MKGKVFLTARTMYKTSSVPMEGHYDIYSLIKAEDGNDYIYFMKKKESKILTEGQKVEFTPSWSLMGHFRTATLLKEE